MEKIYWVVTALIALPGFVHCLVHLIVYLRIMGRAGSMKPVSMKELLEMKDELSSEPRYLRLEGTAEQDDSLQSPFSRKDVVYFDAHAEQCWISDQGKKQKKETMETYHNIQFSPFFLADNTGKARVLIHRQSKIQAQNDETDKFTEPLDYPGVEFKYKSFKPRYVKEEYFEYKERYIPAGNKVYFYGKVQYGDDVFLLKPTEDKTVFELDDPLLKYVAGSNPKDKDWQGISGISDISPMNFFSEGIKKVAIYGLFFLLCASCMFLSLVSLTGHPVFIAGFLNSSQGMVLSFFNVFGIIVLFIVDALVIKRRRSSGGSYDNERYKFEVDRRQSLSSHLFKDN